MIPPAQRASEALTLFCSRTHNFPSPSSREPLTCCPSFLAWDWAILNTFVCEVIKQLALDFLKHQQHNQSSRWRKWKGTPKALEELMDSSAASTCSASAAYTKPIKEIKTWKTGNHWWQQHSGELWVRLPGQQGSRFLANLVEVRKHPKFNFNTIF